MSTLLTEPTAPAGPLALDGPAFQDLIPGNHCWGCAPANPAGLRIRSHWLDGDESVCVWRPGPHHTAGPAGIVNGGILAAILDCHAVCTAIAAAHRREDRPLDARPAIRYATASLAVEYLRPTPAGRPLVVQARIADPGARRTTVSCTLFAGAAECAQAEVVAARVPADWWPDVR